MAGEYNAPFAYDSSGTYNGVEDLLSPIDTGLGGDAATLLALLTTSDVGVGIEVALLNVPISVADSGSGSDTAAPSQLVPVVDAGSGAESAVRTITTMGMETGSGSELAVIIAQITAFEWGTSFEFADSGHAIVVPQVSRFGEFAFAVQGALGSPPGFARWAMPLGMPDGSGVPEPKPVWAAKFPARGTMALQEVRRELVPWLADFSIPAFTRPLPSLLRGLLPTEALAGNLHTMTPPGDDVWFTFWSRRPGLNYEKYTDGLVEGLRFDFTSGMPLNLAVQAQGREPEFLPAPFSSQNLEDIRTGWLTYIGTEVKFDWNANPPTVLRNETESGSLYLSRPAYIHGNYRGMKPQAVSRGNLSVELSVVLTFQNIDHYRYSVYGGLVQTPAIQTVYGSATMRFFEQDAGNGRYMHVTMPAVQWEVEAPQPLARPESGHVLVNAVGRVIVPAAIGRTGQPITIAVDNGVAAAA